MGESFSQDGWNSFVNRYDVSMQGSTPGDLDRYERLDRQGFGQQDFESARIDVLGYSIERSRLGLPSAQNRALNGQVTGEAQVAAHSWLFGRHSFSPEQVDDEEEFARTVPTLAPVRGKPSNNSIPLHAMVEQAFKVDRREFKQTLVTIPRLGDS